MKKVLITTVQKAPNFGASLQAYALWKYISELGHECKIIDLLRPYHKGYIPTQGFEPFCQKERSWWLNFRIDYIRPLKKNIRDLFRVNKSNLQENELPTFSKKKFEVFDSQIAYTKTYTSIRELYDNPPQADLYITGSDQLWNPTQPYPLEPFFLTYVRKGMKISYATSVGVTKVSKYTKKKFSAWLKSYDAISVREQEAIFLLQPLVSQKISQCCDPTFLLPMEHWRSLASKRQVKNKYIFLFVVGEGNQACDYAECLHKQLGLPVVTNKNIRGYSFQIVNDIGPLEWLALIRDAEMLVTNSFHGCVFSLIMNTPFKVSIFNNRGSRIINLLQQMGDEVLLLSGDDETMEIPTVDFEDAGKRINKLGEKGRNWLGQFLS